MSTDVVRASGVSRRFGAGDTAVLALDDVSVAIGRGHLTAVMGPSGSGKSTLMHILAGLDKPTSGSVEFDGTDITRLGDDELTRLRRDHIGFVFQFFNLLPMLDARENILLPMAIAGRRADPRWLETVIGETRLGDRLTHRPVRAFRRSATARGDCPGADRQAERAVRRRAHRQPGLERQRPRSSNCYADRSTPLLKPWCWSPTIPVLRRSPTVSSS